MPCTPGNVSCCLFQVSRGPQLSSERYSHREVWGLDHSASSFGAPRWNCTEMKSLRGWGEQLWSCQALSEVIPGSSERMALEQTQRCSSCSALHVCCTFQVVLAGVTFTFLWLLQYKSKYSSSGLSCFPLFICCHPSLSGRILQSSSPPVEDELALRWTQLQLWIPATAAPSKNHPSEPAFLRQSNFPLASLEMEVQK